MMFLRSVCLAAVLLAIPFNMSLAADEAASKDGFVVASNSVIPQIANGGGSFFMAFQLMNVTAAPATVTISFLDAQGNPMAIPFVQDGAQVTASTLSETIAPRGIEFAATQTRDGAGGGLVVLACEARHSDAGAPQLDSDDDRDGASGPSR